MNHQDCGETANINSNGYGHNITAMDVDRHKNDGPPNNASIHTLMGPV